MTDFLLFTLKVQKNRTQSRYIACYRPTLCGRYGSLTEAQSLEDFFLLCHGCHNEVVKIEKERGEKKCGTNNTAEKVLKYVLLLSVGKTPLWICS